MSSAGPLLALRGVVKRFAPRRGEGVVALDGVDLDVARGEVVGLVGESGSGKSTLARVAVRLIEPEAGSVTFDGADLLAASGRELKRIRRRLQLVFQDPSLALNPRMSALSLVAEPLALHRLARGSVLRRRAVELLREVGLEPRLAGRRPGELSGGERQRVAIARALALRPDLVICDEPVSALDVSVQAQILELLSELRRRRDMAYLFISHDMTVVESLADRIAVLYAGRIVEIAPAAELAAFPLHPHTRSLRRAILPPDPVAARAKVDGAPAEPPEGPATGPGCKFRKRCTFAVERCRREDPPLEPSGSARWVACFRARETASLPLQENGGGC